MERKGGGEGSAGKEEKDQSEKKGKNSELGIRIGLERKKMNMMGWRWDYYYLMS